MTMKKIIKLTESDLARIVKRVIKENTLKGSLIDMIKDGGWKEATDMVGGDKNLKKLTGINTPMDFLHLFDDLGQVQSEENPDWTLFRYEPKHNLMIYDRKYDYVFINYDKIWEVLENNFGLNHTKIRRFTQKWLSEVYNLRGVTLLIELDMKSL